MASSDTEVHIRTIKSIIQEQLENGLGRLCNIDNITSGLIDSEREMIFRLAKHFAIESYKYTNKSASCDSFGIICAKSFERNYLFALLTANAVKTFRKRKGRAPIVVELGTGSGLNAIASFLVDTEVVYTGYELGIDGINFAYDMGRRYGFRSMNIRNLDFLSADMTGLMADIVINENLDAWFVHEPQFLAAKKILPFTHEHTLFVPGALNFYFERIYKEENLKEHLRMIEFSKPIPDSIVLSQTLEPKQIPEGDFLVYCSADMYDFDGKPVLYKQGVDTLDIKEFNLGGLPKYVKVDGIDRSAPHRLELILDYARKQVIPTGNLILQRLN